ncbi:MAG: 50S ribosomal protein L28 [Dehalococcoidia bacterium]|nr:50S ribosomal protein L28 [Dehalococcoidia bacterium]
MCEICKKTIQSGHNVSHSKRRTHRVWAPNVHRTTWVVNGSKKRLNVCTRCLRTHQKHTQ